MSLISRNPRAVLSLLLAGALTTGGLSALLAACGPFADVSDAGFCPFVLEIFYLGITTGTTPTTYDPTANVTRLQMATFLSRSVDGVVRRGRPRAALGRFWTTQGTAVLQATTVGSFPQFVRSDGEDLWVTNFGSNSVARVHGSDGKLLDTWTGATQANNVLTAFGRVFANALTSGNLYQIDPRQPAGGVTTVATNLGVSPREMAFDGGRIWTANSSGSVSIVTPGASIPWTVTTVTTGFTSVVGALYDGANVWVTDFTAGTLLKLDSAGAILQTVTLGGGPNYPAFDGTNIWVPRASVPSVAVVRASTGAILATLTGNGSANTAEAAFDGERVLATNNSTGTVSLWKAADLSPLGFFSVGGGTSPFGACSDGRDFWIVLSFVGQIGRF